MKREILIAIISLAVGTAFGTGAVFQYMSAQLDKEKFRLERSERLLQLYERKSLLSDEMNELYLKSWELFDSLENKKNWRNDTEHVALNDSYFHKKQHFRKIEEQICDLEGVADCKHRSDAPPAPPVVSQ